MKDPSELFLATTDVGSLPLYDDFRTSKRNVKRATLDKVAAGLDYPCYPQLVGTSEEPMNMNLQFLTPMAELGCGVRIDGGRAHLVGELAKPDRVVGIERAVFFLDFLRENGLLSRIKGPKACVTGPFTLAAAIDGENILRCGASRTDVVSVLAEVVASASRELDRMGFRIISLDEPFLSVMLGRRVLYDYGLDFVIETLDGILEGIGNFSAIHICGAITPLVKEVMVRGAADIIDHEFEGIPRNLRAYTRREIEEADKVIGFGCVSSDSTDVESVDRIRRSAMRGLDLFGDRLLIKPNCGFGGLIGAPSAYEASIGKLRNMVKAARELGESGR